MYRIVFITILTLGLMLPVFSQPEFETANIISTMKKVADYRKGWNKIADMYDPNNPWTQAGGGNNWDVGAYMTGIMALYDVSKDQVYLDFATQWAEHFNWDLYVGGGATPDQRNTNTNPDFIACAQTYLQIYMLDPVPANDYMKASTAQALNHLFNVDNQAPKDVWWWCDALYMAPPVISMYRHITGDITYQVQLDDYWWEVSANLYDDQYDLWYRDNGFKFPGRQTANGSPIFWAPGVAWVIGGLIRTLDYMPADYAGRATYEQQFVDMCAALRARQGSNDFAGMWTTSLMDQAQYPDAESSSTAFFAAAFAWGIRNGLLDSAEYMEPLRMAWSDLAANVANDGRLLRCQHVDWEPDFINTDNSSPEGEGAFLVAGREMVLLNQGAVSVRKRSIAALKTSFAEGSGSSLYGLTGKSLSGLENLPGLNSGIFIQRGSESGAEQGKLMFIREQVLR